MTSGANDGKGGGEPAARHVWGPRSLAALLPDVLRPALRRRSAATARLTAEWELIVGPALAAASQPRRLFGGTLSIAASGAMALEMQHLSVALMERINLHLGSRAVTRLRFLQDFSATRPLPAPPPAPARARTQAAQAVAGLPEGELRDALERLGQAVLGQAVLGRGSGPPAA